MKKLFVLILFFTNNLFFTINFSFSQSSNNVVVEYCAGTWNQWDPCGHVIIDQILQDYPNTIAIAYHGAYNDPWQTYSQGIRNLFGFSYYPSGCIGRKTGIIDRSTWYNEIVTQSLIQPNVEISIYNKNYNEALRNLTLTIGIISNSNLSGDYFINFILTEDSLIHHQTGNGSCTGGYEYIHKNVVKSMISGDTGELIHSGIWLAGYQIIKYLNFTIPSTPQVAIVNNCDLNIFVYKQGSSISTNSNIQNARKIPVIGSTNFSGVNLNLKLISEGLYFPLFNQLSRKDSTKVFIYNSVSPYNKIDSAVAPIDSLSFNGLFQFFNTSSGTYYIVAKHFNCIETWSKAGGEPLINDGSTYNYDFTTSASQAYGNNQILKGAKYCLISGDVLQDGFIDGSDFIIIENDAYNFLTGRFIPSDLNGDNFVDGTDRQIGDNNRSNVVIIP